MAGFTGATVLLALTFCLSSAEESNNAALELLYRSRSVTAAPGSSLQLSSDVVYHTERCGLVHVEWMHLQGHGLNAKLTNPHKYLTTVNETIMAEKERRRQVVTEIFSLASEDAGFYQCWARCQTGEENSGHLIKVTVTD